MKRTSLKQCCLNRFHTRGYHPALWRWPMNEHNGEALARIDHNFSVREILEQTGRGSLVATAAILTAGLLLLNSCTPSETKGGSMSGMTATGGTVGSGGTSVVASIASSGGIPGLGGSTATNSNVPWTVAPGGYVTSGPWEGYAWTFAAGTGSTISPGDFSMLAAGNPLCASGSVGPMVDSSGADGIGINLNQAPGANTPVENWTPTGTGIVINVSNPGGSALRVQIQGPTGATDATDRWCTQFTVFDEPVFLPWSAFNTACWNGSGSTYQMQPLQAVLLIVPGGKATAVSFSACITSLNLQTGGGTGGSGGTSAAGGTTGSGGTESCQQAATASQCSILLEQSLCENMVGCTYLVDAGSCRFGNNGLGCGGISYDRSNPATCTQLAGCYVQTDMVWGTKTCLGEPTCNAASKSSCEAIAYPGARTPCVWAACTQICPSFTTQATCVSNSYCKWGPTPLPKSACSACSDACRGIPGCSCCQECGGACFY
jgi:hypothetical protein